MYYAQIRFGFAPKGHCNEDAEDQASNYLGSLMQGGQIVDDYMEGWTDRGLEVHTYLQGYNALALRNHTKWGKEHHKQTVEFFGHEPECKILDLNSPKSLPRWRQKPYLLLFTAAWNHEPPVLAGFEYAPTYLLPVSQETKMHIYFWQQSYRRHDEIWFECGNLEIPAYKQLVEPTSELSQSGRELCQEIEKATGIPTYYYLMRHWGDSRYEADRVCPGCGRKWRVKGVDPDVNGRIPFSQFQFRCEACRLLSHEATSLNDNRRHAKIGLWKK